MDRLIPFLNIRLKQWTVVVVVAILLLLLLLLPALQGISGVIWYLIVKFPNTPVKIAQDANLFVAEMDAGQTIQYDLKKVCMAYLLCVEGSMTLLSNSDVGDEVTTAMLQRHDG